MTAPTLEEFRRYVSDDPLARAHVDVLTALAAQHYGGTESGGGKPRAPLRPALSEDDLYRAYAATDPSLERVREILGAGEDGDGPGLVKVPEAELERLRAQAAQDPDEVYRQFFEGR